MPDGFAAILCSIAFIACFFSSLVASLPTPKPGKM
jgi:hypothetical protein